MKKLMNNNALKLIFYAGIFCNMSFAMDKRDDRAKYLKHYGSKQQRGRYKKSDFKQNRLKNDNDRWCREVCLTLCEMCWIALAFSAVIYLAIDEYETNGNRLMSK